MKHTIKHISSVLLLLAISTQSAMAYDRPGNSTAQFLKMELTPAGAAMAGSYIMHSRGAESAIYNPAAMILVNGSSVTVNHTEWFANISLDFVSSVIDLNSYGALGLSLTSFYTDQMLVRTPLQPEGTGETFGVVHNRFGLSYAKGLTDHVSFGATASYIRMHLFSGKDQSAVSSDIAALYRTDERDFSFGLKIANFGSSVTFVEKDYPLPLNFTFGLGMNALEFKNQVLYMSITGSKPSGGETILSSGAEWKWADRVFIRGGYKFNHDLESYSIGAGLEIPLGGRKLTINWSMSDYAQMGVTNRIGMDFQL